MEYELSRNMRGMKPSIIREILKQMSDPSLISFAGGNPAPESFPNEEIAAASARLLAQDPAGMLQYSVTEGVPAVLEQVRRFANRHELRVRGQDALLLCTGSQQVLDLATKCLCNEGDTIAVEEPAFLGAYNTFRSYGAKLAGVPMEEDGVDLAALEAVFAAPEKPRFFYCIPNFQNPTGKTMSLAKRRGVLALARRYGVPVLEDDPYDPETYQDGIGACPAVTVTVAVSNDFVASNPEFCEFLSNFSMPSAIISEALAYMQENNADYAAAARWLLTESHPELIDEWLTAEQAETLRAAL